MKGHKADNEFISNFIGICIQNGKDSNELILSEAKKILASIDKKIIQAEKLKLKRSKILDVINAFDTKAHIENKNIINLYKVSNLDLARKICKSLSNIGADLFTLEKLSKNKEDLLFTIKQLLENKIIIKNNNVYSKHEMYYQFVEKVLK